ncbi:hypothetical protein N9P60_00125 [bacterium]|nr:hypothetical protein [bacterium]MDB4319834.1 hypothetical protein [bacterium]
MALDDDFKDVGENIKKLNDLGTETSAVFGDIGKALSGLARDSKDFGSQISDAAKSQRSLAINAQKLASFTKEDLKDKTKANNFAKIAAKVAGERAKIESQIRVLTAQRVNASKAEGAILEKTLENLRNGESYGRDIAEGFDEITKSNKELNNNTKFFDNLSETLGTIPGIGPAIAKPFAEAGKTARKARVEGDGLMKSMGKGALEITKAFSPAIMLASLFEADKLTTDFAKQLGVSKDTAQEIKTSFIVIANSSGKAYLNASEMLKSMTELGNELGAVSGFTEDQVKNQVTLTKQLGLSSQEAAGMAKFSILNNKSSRDQTEEILDQVVGLQKQTGIQLDGRKIVKEIASINGALGAQYGYNTKELAKAAVAANKVGLELKDTEAIANSLLDFETSISNELEAELMIGRELNFEKARELALQGKSAEAAVEVAKNFGSQAEFLKLNVKQREALAKAANVDSNALSDQIAKQELLKKLGVESIQQALDRKMTRDEIIASGGEELLLQYEQQSAADKFADAMTKMKETLGAILEGPLGDILNAFADIAGSAGAIYTIMGALGALSLVRLIGSLATMALTLGLSAGAAIATAAAITLGVGLIAVGAGIYAMTAASEKSQTKLSKKIGDGFFGADGKTQISTKEGGLYEISPNDDVVVAPGAGGMMDRAQGGGNPSQLIAEVKQMNATLKQLLQKDTNIEIDGTILNKKVQQSLSTLG